MPACTTHNGPYIRCFLLYDKKYIYVFANLSLWFYSFKNKSNLLKTHAQIKTHSSVTGLGNTVPPPDLYFDSFSYPAASIVFGNMAIVSLFLLLFFLANPRSCLERYRLVTRGDYLIIRLVLVYP